MRKDFAELIIGDLPDKATSAAKGGHAGNGVCRRPAADFMSGAHFRVEGVCARGIDQLHSAFGQAFGDDEIVFGGGDDINNGIADGNNIQLGIGHRKSPDDKNEPRAIGSALRLQPLCRRTKGYPQWESETNERA